jgi:hypothetical protein
LKVCPAGQTGFFRNRSGDPNEYALKHSFSARPTANATPTPRKGYYASTPKSHGKNIEADGRQRGHYKSKAAIPVVFQ